MGSKLAKNKKEETSDAPVEVTLYSKDKKGKEVPISQDDLKQAIKIGKANQKSKYSSHNFNLNSQQSYEYTHRRYDNKPPYSRFPSRSYNGKSSSGYQHSYENKAPYSNLTSHSYNGRYQTSNNDPPIVCYIYD